MTRLITPPEQVSQAVIRLFADTPGPWRVHAVTPHPSGAIAVRVEFSGIVGTSVEDAFVDVVVTQVADPVWAEGGIR